MHLSAQCERVCIEHKIDHESITKRHQQKVHKPHAVILHVPVLCIKY